MDFLHCTRGHVLRPHPRVRHARSSSLLLLLRDPPIRVGGAGSEVFLFVSDGRKMRPDG